MMYAGGKLPSNIATWPMSFPWTTLLIDRNSILHAAHYRLGVLQPLPGPVEELEADPRAFDRLISRFDQLSAIAFLNS